MTQLSSDPTAPTLSRVLAETLAQHSRQSFGVLGNGNAILIDHLISLGVEYTALRHEVGTIAAADAYSRVSGDLAIATTTYGAGFTNALTSLAEATQARIPMLVVVGDMPTTGRRSSDVDLEMLAAAVGVRTYLLSVSGIERTVERAINYAKRARQPVVIRIPFDLVTANAIRRPAPIAVNDVIDLDDPALIASLSAAVAARPQTEPAAAAVQQSGPNIVEAAEALTDSERPLVLAGHGAWLGRGDTAQQLGDLADTLGALTATTALAQGIFPRAEYDLGIAGGFGQAEAMAKVAEADVVVVVGASLNQFTMRFGELFRPGATVVRVDHVHVEPPHTDHPITHLVLQGDTGDVVTELSTAVKALRSAPSGWRESVSGLEPGGELRQHDNGLAAHHDGLCTDGLLDPRAVAERIAQLLPAERHVTNDGGHFLAWPNMFWPVNSPERMIMVGTAFETIGLGFPTVAGVAAAAPDSTVVLSTGDGGGLMALADFETAIRTARSCVIVVWNDAAYGSEIHTFEGRVLDETPMLLPVTDFAAIGAALGATGVKVDTLQALDALSEWTQSGAQGTLVLDCRISRSIIAPYQQEVLRTSGIPIV